MTEVLDVAHLAARQMRAARLLHAALEEHRAAREALDAAGWLGPAHTRHYRAVVELRRLRKEHTAALAAYNAACDAIDLHPHADQPALFDAEGTA